MHTSMPPPPLSAVLMPHLLWSEDHECAGGQDKRNLPAGCRVLRLLACEQKRPCSRSG